MEHKIGTRITLEVVEHVGCEGCFFHDVLDCSTIACVKSEREDGKGIIYKEVED